MLPKREDSEIPNSEESELPNSEDSQLPNASKCFQIAKTLSFQKLPNSEDSELPNSENSFPVSIAFCHRYYILNLKPLNPKAFWLILICNFRNPQPQSLNFKLCIL